MRNQRKLKRYATRFMRKVNRELQEVQYLQRYSIKEVAYHPRYETFIYEVRDTVTASTGEFLIRVEYFFDRREFVNRVNDFIMYTRKLEDNL